MGEAGHGEALQLRPHHILDVVTDFEPDEEPGYRPAPGENGVRTFTRMLSGGLGFPIELVVGPDFICAPCAHLRADGTCDRMLERHDPPEPMDAYNDRLDRRIFRYLGLSPGTVMTLGEFLVLVDERVPGIEQVCTHPTQSREARLAGLIRGLARLGVRRGTGRD